MQTRNRIVVAAALGVATLALTAGAASAQGYSLGFGYSDCGYGGSGYSLGFGYSNYGSYYGGYGGYGGYYGGYSRGWGGGYGSYYGGYRSHRPSYGYRSGRHHGRRHHGGRRHGGRRFRRH